MTRMPRRSGLLHLAHLAVGGSFVTGLLTARAVRAAPREIEIVARRFEYTPREITLRAGEPVMLALRSLDFVHGFNIPGLGVRADLPPGRVTRIEITPRQAGSLDFVCDNFCGDHHEEMHGRFLVEA